MKTAFVHDWLVGRGGGEKVLEAMLELYDGSIHTLLHNREAYPTSRSVNTSFIQKLPFAKKHYRNYLPLFPQAIERFDLSCYDLILSTSHAVAKGIKKSPHQIHICYCHTPMRYAWDLYEFHLSHLNPAKRSLARPILKYMRRWDLATQERVDHYIANSKCVANRIKKTYGRDSTVIYPPVDTDKFTPSNTRGDYYITISRLVPYKRIDLIVAVFAQMPDKKLIVIGDGPEMLAIKKLATSNIELLGHQSNSRLQELLPKARAFVFAADEDFGIVPVEAQASGIPVIAFGKGGCLETVISEKTGLFFFEQTPESLIQAVEAFENMEDRFDPGAIRQHALGFSKKRFQVEYKGLIENIRKGLHSKN